jgi:hypothetical protein
MSLAEGKAATSLGGVDLEHFQELVGLLFFINFISAWT